MQTQDLDKNVVANERPGARLADFELAPDMASLLNLLPRLGVQGGWAKPEPSLWPSPKQNFEPAHWSYALSKAALAAAGKFVSAEQAERRNLILVNPVKGNTYATVRTMVSAYQMVKPGEVAPSHRHTPNALRLIVDSDADAFTVVNGARLRMEPGDIVLTPSWQWHGHVNESPRDATWIDFLDVPTVQFLEPMFLDHHPDNIEHVTQHADTNMRITGRQIKLLLDAASSRDGYRCVPLDTPQLKTMGLQISRLDDEATVRLPRTTANAIYAVMSGEGHVTAGESHFALAKGDVFANPAWRSLDLTGTNGLNLLRVSDEPMVKALGWLRHEDVQA